MLYKFYHKGDSQKESIHTIQAKNKNTAIESFARLKRLPIEAFNKIFEVAEYDRSEKKA